MARPRNDEREDRIVEAAIGIIASNGLGTPTAAIAKAAGVSNGSLFTYFATKAALLNRLYVTLKTEMSAAITNIDSEASDRDQLRQIWQQWLRWAGANQNRRKVLALLMVSEDITPSSRQKGDHGMAPIVSLVDRCRTEGVLRSAPMALVTGLVIAMAEATMDSIAHDPRNANEQEMLAFEALWRALT
jgi:AcrR family transcriptional regulator